MVLKKQSMTAIYQLKIEIEGNQPYWRRIQVAADTYLVNFMM
jgi:hypothetical protein